MSNRFYLHMDQNSLQNQAVVQSPILSENVSVCKIANRLTVTIQKFLILNEKIWGKCQRDCTPTKRICFRPV